MIRKARMTSDTIKALPAINEASETMRAQIIKGWAKWG
jgi:hypothetical protein